jgi:23S rRNA-/tRNA-specific pseudouridylate synthase
VSGPNDRFWAELPLGRDVTLLAHDANGVAAFAQPAGGLWHPNESGDEPRSLLTVRYALDGEFFAWTDPEGANRRLWLLNRLDSATSGVILAAADHALATEIRVQFKRKQVRKIYYALVFGAPRQPMEIWRDLLAVDKRGGKIRAATSAGHVPAESRMSVVRTGRQEPKVSLIRLEPRTGRSHQLRVQCAKRHLPIIGDQTYGDFSRNREFAKRAGTKRLFLHSLETQFDYTWREREWKFAAKAPLPDAFEKFL